MTVMFSVIIPTCNRPSELRICLSRLAPGSQTLPASLYEIIVSDDGKRAPASEMVERDFHFARWTAGPSKGPAANRNHGASIATGEWLVFIDDDCVPEPCLLQAYSEVIESCPQESAVILEGPTVRSAEPRSLLWEAPHNPSATGHISANFAIRRLEYVNTGRFDERYPSAAIEDTEYFARFEAMGGKCVAVPRALVHHPIRRCGSALQLAKKWEGKVILALDHGASPWTVRWRLPWHVFRVIQSRFRKQSLCIENLYAFWLFICEWAIVVYKTPGWVQKWSAKPRSSFWKTHVAEHGPPPRHGF